MKPLELQKGFLHIVNNVHDKITRSDRLKTSAVSCNTSVKL